MNVAFIPVRGGSKSIPLKNIKAINGRPLVFWVLDAACGCSSIDLVYIATDSTEITQVVEEYPSSKVRVISRSPETATDTASTESALLEFAKNYTFDTVALIQATSPLLSSDDLDKGFLALENPTIDSVLSVVPQKRFIWRKSESGYEPVNYDFTRRPRRQEFSGYLVENGAFYITSRDDLLKSSCRLSGSIAVVEMAEESYFEIDEPSDWIIVESLLKKRSSQNTSRKKKIRLFVTDCDGCLTDGGMYYSDDGTELKKFNTVDGMGISLLQKKGITVAIITGENSQIVVNRARKLNISDCYLGVKDKLHTLKELCTKYSITLDEVAYLGDDINDLDCVGQVGLGCCVANGQDDVKRVAAYVTKLQGGQGAVREVCELILSADEDSLERGDHIYPIDRDKEVEA